MVFPLLRGIWSVAWVSAPRFLDLSSRDQGIVCCKAPRACDQTAASQSPSVFCHLWVHSCEREPVCYPWRYWLPKLKEPLGIQRVLRKLPRCLLYSPFFSLPQEAVLTSLVMHWAMSTSGGQGSLCTGKAKCMGVALPALSTSGQNGNLTSGQTGPQIATFLHFFSNAGYSDSGVEL